MIKKVIAFNGSPRKGWYTDKLVHKCLEGAKSVGAEVKLYQVSDLKNIKHCISCLSCKRKDKKYFGTCVLKDDLTPILKEIKKADVLIFGSPVYYSDVTAALHPILERMWFSNSTYSKNGQRPLDRKIKTAFLMPMNATEQQAKELCYDALFDRLRLFNTMIFGHCEIFPVYDTMQTDDYNKYDMSVFDTNEKVRRNREVFPHQLEEAYELGKKLAS